MVEGRFLDAQQMECVSCLEHNHLVVAGAGTGKTTTIIGKLKWLLAEGKLKPEDILVLSFTNASAAEMRERIITETGEEIMAATFHKLGLEIVRTVKPDVKITKRSLEEYVVKELKYSDVPAEGVVGVANLMRMDNLSGEEVLKKRKWGDDEATIIKIAGELISKYQQTLRAADEIDFTDMINLATEFVRTGKYRHRYKFVVVDEYQDISMARFRLLKEMRESRDYDLFCVGDDWQAIYRFAGSEIDLILNFEKYWGATKISKIETTYRFPQTLADASGKFVMENYAQITKKVKALPDPMVPVFRKDGSPKLNRRGEVKMKVDFAVEEICADTAAQGLEWARRQLYFLPRDSTVYFIGRYTRDVNFLQKMGDLIRSAENSGAGIPFWFLWRPDLKIEFLTAHKSKGLQADFVFAINLVDGKKGFPSKLESEPIVRFLHGKEEKYPYAEERRLFYVTMTRAKKKLFLLTTHSHKSEFVTELEDLLYGKMPVIDIGLMED